MKKEFAIRIIFSLLIFVFFSHTENKSIVNFLPITFSILTLEFLIYKKRKRLKNRALGYFKNLLQNIHKYEEIKEPTFSNIINSIDGDIASFIQMSISKNILDQSFVQLTLAENKKLFDIVPDPIMIVDKNLKILKINSKAKENFGQILKKHLYEIQNISTNLINTIKKSMSENKNKSTELDNNESIGKFFSVKISPLKIPKSHKNIAIVLFSDITKRKRQEILEKEFFSNISHEIKSPLTSIIGFSENIKDTNLSEELKNEFICIIQQQCIRLNSLISNTFSLTREIDNDFKNFSIKEALDKAIRESKFLLLQEGFKIHIDIDKKKENSYISKGNIESIISVFTNLISNSVKYGNKNSTIKIKFSKKMHNKILYNSVELEDQSKGIETEELKKITQRFYRCAKSKKNNSITGHGIGLYIVSTIVKKHKGLIHIDSVIGKGSTFKILIPTSLKSTSETTNINT